MKIDYSNHPSNPAAQPFVGRGTKNKTKVNTRWNPGSKTYWRRSGGK